MEGRPTLFRPCPRACAGRERRPGAPGPGDVDRTCPVPDGTEAPPASVCPLGSSCALANEPALSDGVLDALQRAAHRKAGVWGLEEDELRNEGYVWLADDDGRALRSFQGRSTLETFVGAILEKRLIDEHRRSHGRRRPRKFVGADALEGLAAPGADPESDLLRREEEQAVARLSALVDALPQDERLAARLRHVEGLSPREIARLLDVSAFSVYGLLRSAKKKLRTALTGTVVPIGGAVRPKPAGPSD